MDITKSNECHLLEALRAKKNIICSGVAGTGKTAVIREYIRQLRENAFRVAICVFTGKAARNVHGFTIQSFFKLGVQLYTPESIEKEAKDKIANVDTIIIDEFSTIGFNLLYELIRTNNYSQNPCLMKN